MVTPRYSQVSVGVMVHQGVAIGVRPAIEPSRRMQDVLDAMDHQRAVGIVLERDQALEPQQPCAVRCAQKVEKQGDGGRRDGAWIAQAEGADRVIAKAAGLRVCAHIRSSG